MTKREYIQRTIQLRPSAKQWREYVMRAVNYNDCTDYKTAEKEFVRQTGSKSIRTKSVRWLYAPANGGNGDGK